MLKKLSVLCVALCVSTAVYAQKKNLVKGVINVATSKVPTTLGAQVERQVARQAGKSSYHPVFGYIPSLLADPRDKGGAITPFIGHLRDFHKHTRLIQVAPLTVPLKNVRTDKNFVVFGQMTLPQLTQATYLWRLAHPESSQDKYTDSYPGLMALAEDRYTQTIEHYFDYVSWDVEGWTDIIELPNLQFLQRLADPNFTPVSYAKLYELTPVYPKHVTLNDYGFPVKTADADYADILDNYLMLSNSREMGAFVNVSQPVGPNGKVTYTPFVLTKEEHAFADKLLALRLEREKLPPNPTPRDLLELAYNRLETHCLSYTKINEIYSKEYKAYPNYKNTELYRTIKELLKNEDPHSYPTRKSLSARDYDILHLFILDAIMGGVEKDNFVDKNRALISYDIFKLTCNAPHDEFFESHLRILRDNLFRNLLEK